MSHGSHHLPGSLRDSCCKMVLRAGLVLTRAVQRLWPTVSLKSLLLQRDLRGAARIFPLLSPEASPCSPCRALPMSPVELPGVLPHPSHCVECRVPNTALCLQLTPGAWCRQAAPHAVTEALRRRRQCLHCWHGCGWVLWSPRMPSSRTPCL